MAWTSPRTWVSNEIVTAALLNTHVRDNLGYLISRPNSQILRDNGADYTTTSGTFAAIDTTNLSITLTMTTTKVLLVLVGAATNDTTGSAVGFDFFVDGTRVGAAYAKGLVEIMAPVGNYQLPLTLFTIATVSTGSRVFKPVWRASANTAKIGSGGTIDTGIFFAAIEVA